MDVTGDDVIKATGLGATILGGFATAITWIVSRSSNSAMKPLSPDDLSELRSAVRNLAASHTRSQIDSAEIKKDIQHILEKMERFEQERERDHLDVKKLTRILYPLLKDEIRTQRSRMGLDAEADEMPLSA